jgi:hypothetical protein
LPIDTFFSAVFQAWPELTMNVANGLRVAGDRLLRKKPDAKDP